MTPNDEASARKRRHESWEARDKELWASVEAGTIAVSKYLQRIAEPLEGDHNEAEAISLTALISVLLETWMSCITHMTATFHIC